MSPWCRIVALAICLQLCAANVSPAQESPTTSVLPEIEHCANKAGGATVDLVEEDRQLVARVAARILLEVQEDERKAISDYAWPPKICIHPTDVVNAYASLQVETIDGREVKTPRIQINQGYLDKIVRGDDEFFAKVFGHELSHILLRHVDPKQDRAGPLAWNAVSREHETNADILGMKLALRANYQYRSLVASMARERDDGNFCAFKALASTHPAWADRLAAIDDRQSELWRATSAFENGVNFLGIEQYGMAARCFQQVVKDFPRCHEGWADLGYAKLMLYCDGLAPADVRRLKLGQLAVGGFYRRAESIEPSRGIPEEEWKEAVAAFREALRIKPKSIVPSAGLATALLVQPEDRDLAKVNEMFAGVIAALDARDVVEPLPTEVKAAILANAGAAKAAAGDAKGAHQLFLRVDKLIGKDPSASGAAQAVAFHRAQMLAAHDDDESRTAAIEQWSTFLSTTAMTGVWWDVAYQDYMRLCGQMKVKARPREAFDLARKVKSRPVLTVAFEDGKSVTVGLPVSEATTALGEGEQSELIRGTKVHQRKYRERGVDLVSADVVLAVRLRGKRAPALKLTPLGGGPERATLKVGMKLSEFEEAVAGSGADYDTRFGTGSSIAYRFYPQLGIGVSLDDKQVIDEIVVGQLPYPPPSN